MECKGLKETIKITLMDGRELICTPEHKIKVKYDILKDITNLKLGYKTEYLYKEAKDLITMENKLSDTIVSSIEYPEDNINDNINSDWELNMGEFNFNMKTYKEREKSLAFARILGFLLTDGTIHKIKDQKDKYATRLSIG
jgi:intein/homing endonuclease